MKEPAFLKRNKEKWKEFESKLARLNEVSPDDQAEMFIELTDGLAYAQTYFPNSKSTNYLNGLTVQLHQSIYKNKKERSNRIWTFWKEELPTLFYHSHKQLLYAFLIFTIAIAIGALSEANDNTFVRMILGDQYVNMTEQNIDEGDPMGVYRSANETEMFLGITLNNIRVSFIAFVMGVFLSVGTGMILFMNGIMVGAFMCMFYKKGLIGTAFLAVFIHGTLELSAIVIAGCAGFVMGNSILFPGTFSRLESFKRGFKQGLKIVIGLVPIFIAAGFLESFVTRHYQHSWVLNLSIIIVSFVFIIWYFVVYPIQLNRLQDE